MTKRIFNRFRHHRAGTFVSYDHEDRTLTWRADGSDGVTEEWVRHGLPIELERLAAGTRLRVQDGEMDRNSSDMRGGRRQFPIGRGGALRTSSIYTGYGCITAIAHPEPRISLMALRLLERVFLPHVTPEHIRHFAQGASTGQAEATVRTNRWDLDLKIHDGLLTASRRLSPSVMANHDRIAFDSEGMPDTLLAALEGRPVRNLIGHPALMDDDLVIDRVHRSGLNGGAWAHLRQPSLTPEEALARLTPATALAA